MTGLTHEQRLIGEARRRLLAEQRISGEAKRQAHNTEKTARLRELRLAKEAAERTESAAHGAKPRTRPARR